MTKASLRLNYQFQNYNLNLFYFIFFRWNYVEKKQKIWEQMLLTQNKIIRNILFGIFLQAVQSKRYSMEKYFFCGELKENSPHGHICLKKMPPVGWTIEHWLDNLVLSDDVSHRIFWVWVFQMTQNIWSVHCAFCLSTMYKFLDIPFCHGISLLLWNLIL